MQLLRRRGESQVYDDTKARTPSCVPEVDCSIRILRQQPVVSSSAGKQVAQALL